MERAIGLAGYIAVGCVEDKTWMIWGNSSIVAVASWVSAGTYYQSQGLGIARELGIAQELGFVRGLRLSSGLKSFCED